MQALKFLATLITILVFFVGGLIISFLPVRFWTKQQLKTKWIQWCCKVGLFIMQVKAHIKGQLPESSFVVCNHMSYLDILVLTQIAPMSFVTSQEIRETPVLGWLCQVGGCLFVDRRSKKNIENEIQQITNSLKNNQNVVVFPEATSTNGEEVLRFKRPLYNAPIFADKPVSVLCLNYTKINNHGFNEQNRDYICWYGDMSFVPHLWKLMSLKSVKAEVEVCEVLSTQGQSADQLALSSHTTVTKFFKPVEKGVSYAGSSSSNSHWAKA
ncbi:MAG: 1-acyl-sn-glycerol-3-phosphate acyltransferase [Bdellovibrionales bacterium]|nr:1-acyl-sn-glycerol-3-phosphate acyltransferase [Bdellovibrionales bacterium]